MPTWQPNRLARMAHADRRKVPCPAPAGGSRREASAPHQSVGPSGLVIFWSLVIGVSTVLGISPFVPAAWACDTPVYRYAMYRWIPAPYRVFLFHRGELGAEDQEVRKRLVAESEDPAGANLSLIEVDLRRNNPLDGLPEVVRKDWEAQSGKALPVCLVYTAWGEMLFAGRLDPAQLRALIQSPLRTRIGEKFEQGYGVILLILEGKDPTENGRIEAAAQAVIAKAAAGQIPADPFATAPSDSAPVDAPGLSNPTSEPGFSLRPPPLKVAVLKLDRASPDESWLVKMLLAMDPEAAKQTQEPMLFAIYGRGRVMPPGIGREVHLDSLTNLLSFLADRCSCTVKDQNPGLDLLMKWNWEAVAEKFAAEEDASLEQPLYAEQPADQAAAQKHSAPAPAVAQDAPDAVNSAMEGSTALQASVGAGRPGTPVSTGSAETSPAPAPRPEVAATTPASTPVHSDAPRGQGTESFARRQLWQLGAGLAIIAVIVLVGGVVLVRNRQNGAS